MSLAFEGALALRDVGGRRALCATLAVTAPIAFHPLVRVRFEGAGEPVGASSSDTFYLGWLPRGRYTVECFLPDTMASGAWTATLEAVHKEGMQFVQSASAKAVVNAGAPKGGGAGLSWNFEGISPAPRLADLSWKKGASDWFFRHFDHAGPTIMSYLLKDAPQLKGRILDVGCGDGITDLSIALRTGCEQLIGIDPFHGYDRLQEVMAENHLPSDAWPKNLSFAAEDGRKLPYRDSEFDVIISWGSVEHMAEGYLPALDEMRRVLKPGGLLFIHPGLYYSNFGHHLGEFSSEPFFHLKKPLEEVHRIVMTTPPRRMDRAGHVAKPEEYWQWFRELQPITVAQFERELRERDLQPWRVAIRTEDIIEYTPEIESYPMQDLATVELYVSCVNRKKA